MIALMIFVVAVFVFFMALGYYKGCVRTILSLVVFTMPFLLSYFLAPIVTDVIIQKTNIDDYFCKKIEDRIYETTKKKVSSELEANYGIVDEEICNQVTEQALQSEMSKVEEIEFINNLKLPQFATGALVENNTDEVRSKLNAHSFYDYVSLYFTRMIMRALVFVVLYATLWVVLRIIMWIILIAAQLPMLSTANRLTGMVLGIFEALVVVWVFFAIVAVCAQTSFGENVLKAINDNSILKFLFDKNVIMHVITDIKNAI